MVKKLRVSIALQPVATALFANSPFTEGKPNGFLSFRSEIWRDTDNARSGMLPWVFEDGMGFERWVDYALDVPMYFVKRGETYIDVAGLVPRLLRGPQQLASRRASDLVGLGQSSFDDFPEVRLKRYLEMRGADGVPWGRPPALPAFWVGLLYDDESLNAAWDLVSHWTAQERQALRDDVPRFGFKARIGIAICSRSPGVPEAVACRLAAAWPHRSTRPRREPSLEPLERILERAARRRKRCWTNSTASGAVPWSPPIRNTRFTKWVA